MTSSQSCTILIPTHNRAHYLERCILWFREIPYPIVIADSSATEWRSPLRDTAPIEYVHRPGGIEAYLPKLQAALAKVTTPLVTMCADDDFITADGLRTSIDFLNTHKDYVFSQGHSYVFQPFGSWIVVWSQPHPHHDVPQDSWIERVEAARSTAYYGVQRTEVLRESIDFLARQDFSEILLSIFGFLDMCITANAARHGKFKRCPAPFGLREYASFASSVGTRTATIESRNIPDFYHNLLELLTKGHRDDAVRARLQKFVAADYAGQINYDLAQVRSRKAALGNLPAGLVGSLEFAWRAAVAIRSFAKPDGLSAAKIFRHPEYGRFRALVATQSRQ